MCWIFRAAIAILPSMPRKAPESIQTLLDRFIELYPRKKALKRGMLLQRLPHILGPRMAAQVASVKIDGHKVLLRVPDAAWRHEISSQRYALLTRLNAEINEELVREIVVLG